MAARATSTRLSASPIKLVVLHGQQHTALTLNIPVAMQRCVFLVLLNRFSTMAYVLASPAIRCLAMFSSGIATNSLPCYVFLWHRQQSAALLWFLLASPAIPCHAMISCVRAQLARSFSAVARASMGIASILHRCSPYACFHGAVRARSQFGFTC